MPVKYADIDRSIRYQNWYPLLLKELRIFCKPTSCIITIGSWVRYFLDKNKFESTFGKRLHTILHYSDRAAKYRDDFIKKYMNNGFEQEFSQFEASIKKEDIIATANDIMNRLEMSDYVSRFIVNRLKNSELSLSKKKLLFGYKLAFQRIKQGQLSPFHKDCTSRDQTPASTMSRYK